MGFWMKLAVVQALVLSNLSFINWFLTVTLLLITLVGGYNYLRIFYVILSETNNPNVDIVNLPNTKTDFIPYVLWFIVSQIFFVGYYDTLNSLFDSILLFTGNILDLSNLDMALLVIFVDYSKDENCVELRHTQQKFDSQEQRAERDAMMAAVNAGILRVFLLLLEGERRSGPVISDAVKSFTAGPCARFKKYQVDYPSDKGFYIYRTFWSGDTSEKPKK
jgi:hypothetical protein